MSKDGGYTSSGNNPSMPHFVPTTDNANATPDISTRKIQTARVQYFWTSTDDSNGYATVKVNWDEPFPDANYTIVWSPNDVSQVANDLGYFNGDTHSRTMASFIAIVYSYSPGSGIPNGSIIEINAIAIHD